MGTPVNEVAEYLGDDARTVLAVYAHILGEGQRLDFAQRLAAAEWAFRNPGNSTATLALSAPQTAQIPDARSFGI